MKLNKSVDWAGEENDQNLLKADYQVSHDGTVEP